MARVSRNIVTVKGFPVELTDAEMCALLDALTECVGLGTDFEDAYKKLKPLYPKLDTANA